jgi:hypothetical protein
VTYQLNEWRNGQWSDALECLDSEDQSLWKMTKRVMRVPIPSPPSPLQVPGGLSLSDSEKAEALADNLEARFQPVDDQSDPAFTEMVDEAMSAYQYAPASEPILTTPSEILQATRGLKVGKASGPNGIPDRVLRRLLREVNERGLLRDEQFGVRPRHSTTLQLARIVERVNRNFDERRRGFLDVAKAFDTVWAKGLLYKLTVRNFTSYLVKTVSSYLDCQTFETSF